MRCRVRLPRVEPDRIQPPSYGLYGLGSARFAGRVQQERVRRRYLL